MGTEQFEVIVPDDDRTLGQGVLPPYGTLVTKDSYNPAAGYFGQTRLQLYTTLDGQSTFAAFPEELRPVGDDALKPKDVTVEVGGAKATFTGSDVPAGYIVAAIVVVVSLGIALLGKFNPDLFNIILK